MNRIMLLLAILGLCGWAPAVRANPNPPAVAHRSEPSPEAVQAAREMLEAMQVDRQMQVMTETMLGPIVQNQMRRYQNMTAEQRDALTAATLDGMRAIMPQYMERVVAIYAAAFTVPEMNAIRDFYRSPAGRASLDRLPQISAESTNAMLPLLPLLEREIRDSLCRRVNCGDLQPSSVS